MQYARFFVMLLSFFVILQMPHSAHVKNRRLSTALFPHLRRRAYIGANTEHLVQPKKRVKEKNFYSLFVALLAKASRLENLHPQKSCRYSPYFLESSIERKYPPFFLKSEKR